MREGEKGGERERDRVRGWGGRECRGVAGRGEHI